MTVKISAAKPTIACPATLFLPADGGQLQAHKFTVIFRRVPTSERDDLARKSQAGELPIAALLDQVVVGWEGMTDAAGDAVPYNAAERAAAEEAYAGVEQAMAVAFWDHLFVNQREAAEKNSAAQSATA
ncbi:hypothetical protein [Variovorax sp.]|uniref:hypothetical protein n=1 Tax=Variovorax sp. TaxID=1871043 RepID=UPI003BACC49A